MLMSGTGEISAVNNCTAILTDPEGRYKLSPIEAITALEQLSLYTTAEPCPMVLLHPAFSYPLLTKPTVRNSNSLLSLCRSCLRHQYQDVD